MEQLGPDSKKQQHRSQISSGYGYNAYNNKLSNTQTTSSGYGQMGGGSSGTSLPNVSDDSKRTLKTPLLPHRRQQQPVRMPLAASSGMQYGQRVQQQHQQQQQQQVSSHSTVLQRAMSRGRDAPRQAQSAGYGKQFRRDNKRAHNRLPQIGGGEQKAANASQQAVLTAHQQARAARRAPSVAAQNAAIEFTSQGGQSTAACGVCSIKGHKPGNPNWTNQDNYSIAESVGGDPSTRIYIVLDGHGEHGHHVSMRCHDNLPKYLMSTDFDAKRSNSMMQSDLNNCSIDVKCSGATCVTCVIKGNKMQLGNCGDSRAVLGRKQGNNPQHYTAVPLTRDHKPDRQDEKRRIQEAGGQVGCRQIVVGHSATGPVMLPMGPARVWYTNRGETMGLAMSRSLGDAIVHTVGVSAEPELTDHEVGDLDEFIVMATDGVWDVIDNNQAVEIVSSHVKRAGGGDWDAEEAASLIARSARRRWSQLSNMIDDITCLVIKLH